MPSNKPAKKHFWKDGFAICGKTNCKAYTKNEVEVTCGYCQRKLMPEELRPKQPNRYTMAKEARNETGSAV